MHCFKIMTPRAKDHIPLVISKLRDIRTTLHQDSARHAPSFTGAGSHLTM